LALLFLHGYTSWPTKFTAPNPYAGGLGFVSRQKCRPALGGGAGRATKPEKRGGSALLWGVGSKMASSHLGPPDPQRPTRGAGGPELHGPGSRGRTDPPGGRWRVRVVASAILNLRAGARLCSANHAKRMLRTTASKRRKPRRSTRLVAIDTGIQKFGHRVTFFI